MLGRRYIYSTYIGIPLLIDIGIPTCTCIGMLIVRRRYADAFGTGITMFFIIVISMLMASVYPWHIVGIPKAYTSVYRCAMTSVYRCAYASVYR
jgi:hypothetical protein